MALVFNQLIHNNRLALWKIEESIGELENLLEPHHLQHQTYQTISSESRKKEWLATRLLVKELLGHWPTISHYPSGQPFIENSPLAISISHSHDMAGVLLGTNKQLGLDIENESRNIEKVLNRFLSKIEYQQIKDATMQLKILYWCTKEAVYKAMGTNNIEFSKRIIIKEVHTIAPYNSIKALFIDNTAQKEIMLHYLVTHGNIIVWTL